MKLFYEFILSRKIQPNLKFCRNIVNDLMKLRSCEWSVIELSIVHFVVYITSTARASSVFPSSYRITLFKESARIFS